MLSHLEQKIPKNTTHYSETYLSDERWESHLHNHLISLAKSYSCFDQNGVGVDPESLKEMQKLSQDSG